MKAPPESTGEWYVGGEEYGGIISLIICITQTMKDVRKKTKI